MSSIHVGGSEFDFSDYGCHNATLCLFFLLLLRHSLIILKQKWLTSWVFNNSIKLSHGWLELKIVAFFKYQVSYTAHVLVFSVDQASDRCDFCITNSIFEGNLFSV